MAEHGKRAQVCANMTGMKRVKKEEESFFALDNTVPSLRYTHCEARHPTITHPARENDGGACIDGTGMTRKGNDHPNHVGANSDRFHASHSLVEHGQGKALGCSSLKALPCPYSTKEGEDSMVIDRPADMQDQPNLEQFYVNIKKETSELSALERERREHTTTREDLKASLSRQQRDLSDLLRKAAQLQKAIAHKRQELQNTTNSMKEEEDGARRCTEEIASRIMSRNSQINGH